MASRTKTNRVPPRLYITRMDYERNHGWFVRIPRANRKPGEGRLAASRLFSDGVWGGKRKALVAAREWRDRMLKKYPRGERYRHRGIVPPGHGYVRFAMRRYYHRDAKRTITLHPAWVGWLRVENGKAKGANASIEKWGQRAARQRVDAWLERERRALAKRLGMTYARLVAQSDRVLPIR